MNMQQMFEGIRSGTPQCDITSHEEGRCEWASVMRYRTQCGACGHQAIRFFCPGHNRGLMAGKVRCYHCNHNRIWTKVS